MKLKYRDVFFAVWGVGPWPCAVCDCDVTVDRLHIHHVDHNHDNAAATNLVPLHIRCHALLHKNYERAAERARGVPLTEERRTRISHAHRTSAAAAAARETLRQTNTGSKRSIESRALMSASAKNRASRA